MVKFLGDGVDLENITSSKMTPTSEDNITYSVLYANLPYSADICVCNWV